MMPVTTIRAAVRAKFVMPYITVREQARVAGTSPSATHRMNKRCERYGVDHLLLEQLNDTEAKEALRIVSKRTHDKREPDYNSEIEELAKSRKKRKSRTQKYLEYRAIDPITALSKSQYFRKVNKVLKRVKIVMKQHHAAGETMYIDYCGTKVYYTKKGQKVWVKVFVAVLGASKKIFAFATEGEKTIHWVDGMTRAVEYYGGCPETVSMDNAKALVNKAGLIANLVDNVEAWGLHYNCLMDTCRVGRPQDKSLVELGVKFITQRILVPMLDMTFFSLNEINRYLARGVEQLNNERFQGFDISRNNLFDFAEREILEKRGLPDLPFEMVAERKFIRVKSNYHFKYKQHEYSVPYKYASHIVDVIVTQSHLKVLYQNDFVYKHELSHEIMGATTIAEHMPAEHLADYKICDKELNLKWAKKISKPVAAIVKQWYSETQNPQSRPIAKRCKALMDLVQKRGEDVVTNAVEYALAHQMDKPTDLNLIISAQKQEGGFDKLPTFVQSHQNVRGKEYFGGDYDA